jgi:hypothetical protein
MRPQPAATRRLLLLVAIAALLLYQHYGPPLDGQAPPSGATPGSQQSDSAAHWRAGQWIEVRGTVQRVLSDDNEGSRHQRFILQLPKQRTLLVAHNIDLARRVPLKRGDTLRLRGRYEPNERGGVLHWTHHDPAGMNTGGWIEYQGVRYE